MKIIKMAVKCTNSSLLSLQDKKASKKASKEAGNKKCIVMIYEILKSFLCSATWDVA